MWKQSVHDTSCVDVNCNPNKQFLRVVKRLIIDRQDWQECHQLQRNRGQPSSSPQRPCFLWLPGCTKTNFITYNSRLNYREQNRKSFLIFDDKAIICVPNNVRTKTGLFCYIDRILYIKTSFFVKIFFSYIEFYVIRFISYFFKQNLTKEFILS